MTSRAAQTAPDFPGPTEPDPAGKGSAPVKDRTPIAMTLTQTPGRPAFLTYQSDADKALIIRADAVISVVELPVGPHGQARSAITLSTGSAHIVRHSVEDVMRAIAGAID